jgi:glycosyltransferase involved in cell wall biosynthesis
MQGPVKLLYVFYEPSHSGQATHVISLAKHLGGYDITVICPREDEITQAELRESGVRVLPWQMHKLKNLRPTLALMHLCKTERFAIMHVHSVEAGLWARVAAKVAGAPVVIYTPHNIDVRNRWLQWLYPYLERVLSFFTDMIISVNETDRIRLIQRRMARPEKVITIYYGIDPGRFTLEGSQDEYKQRLGVDPRKPLVLQMGRLREQKAPQYFLQAAAEVLREIPDVEFALLGEGPLEPELRRLAFELGIASNVHFLGWREDVPEVLAATDISVLTSLWEGLPYSVLESMAAGKPVVATSVNGTTELVVNSETGFLVPPRSPHAVAEKVITLLRDPELAATMGELGRRRVEEHFSVQAMIRKAEAVYQSLLDAKLFSWRKAG